VRSEGLLFKFHKDMNATLCIVISAVNEEEISYMYACWKLKHLKFLSCFRYIGK